MSKPHAVETSSHGVTTVVVVVPSHPEGKDFHIARALESAALALRSWPGQSEGSAPGRIGEEAALMRRVEAEVYGIG